MKGKNFNKPDALAMINYCNTQISNETEYAIAKVILSICEEEDDISLDQLACRAHVSEASVSRFIRKAGFADYQEFRERYLKSLVKMNMGRKISSLNNYKDKETDGIAHRLYQDALDNMNATLKTLDYGQMKKIADRMKHAASVTFYGDDHTLSIFYTVQLDLISSGVPAYLFKKREIQNIHSDCIGKDDVIVYLNVFHHWMHEDRKQILSNLHREGKGYIIGFFQDTDSEIESFFDEIVYYGIGGSYNNGFFSLQLMSQMLSEFFYI